MFMLVHGYSLSPPHELSFYTNSKTHRPLGSVGFIKKFDLSISCLLLLLKFLVELEFSQTHHQLF